MMSFRVGFAAILATVLLGSTARAEEDATTKAQVDFEQHIRPLLRERCVACHGAEENNADLRLDAKAFALQGGATGPVIVPRDSANSLLYQRVASEDESERMPPEGEPLSADEVAQLKAWIDAGAEWPENEQDRAAAIDPRLQHWAFQPLRTFPDEPHSVDLFLEQKLAEQGLSFSPPADRRTLIRRVYFDLLGLPPAPEEIEAFVADADPRAYERLVDRLLASPHYGERWARHWLDVVRFAESDGFETNLARAHAWPYRDYVIRALNADRPYDQFIREQLAGDALGEDAATGFLVGGAYDRVKSPDPVLTANQRANELNDMVSTTAATFLGLTLNCARCHDHKFDPIPAEDYYAFVAMLQGVQHGERPLPTRASPDDERRRAALQQELASIDAQLEPHQPAARLGRVVLIDDASPQAANSQPGVVSFAPSSEPVTYSPGPERGQADDPGDVTRLPNLGEKYRYWTASPAQQTDYFAWHPRLEGRFRIWISWGAWTTHTADARYVLDRDGNPSTRDDQTEIAAIDQRQFADAAPAMPEQRRWSGFRAAGVHELESSAAILLRSGTTGGPTVAEVMAFEEVLDPVTPPEPAVPHVRPPVGHRENEDRFPAVEARFVRFTVTASSTVEPCLDELEVFTARADSRNVALAEFGTRATASSTYADGGNPKHKLEHINDGRYGNDFSWISNEPGAGWVQLEFARPERIDRIVWSRDRGDAGQGTVFEDRLAIGYHIEVSLNGTDWTRVASSADRLGPEYRPRITDVATLEHVPDEQAAAVARLVQRRAQLQTEVARLSEVTMVYAGTFEQPGKTYRHYRGDPMQPRDEVAPGALSRIGKPLRLAADTPDQQRRLALANWIADPANPLTARVIVNRLWHYHFGTGIVDTPSDFGLNGSRPTHPELLDWLAQELLSHAWSLKHVHRLMLLSRAYQQSSATNEAAFELDSACRLLWRYPPRRLEAEALRDTMLAVSGKLDLSMGGPGFDLFEPNDNYVKVYTSKSEFGPAEFRRMVYQSKPRMVLDEFFGAFDCPDAGQPAAKRTSSTTPLQALNLLNGNFAIQQAQFFAARVEREGGSAPAQQVERAFRLALGRSPSPQETMDSEQLIAKHGLFVFCRALLNANEFLRVD